MTVADFEECCVCGSHTGRAGRGDDSIYCDDCDMGPFCEGCWHQHEAAHDVAPPDLEDYGPDNEYPC